jgi:hypothetical protein
LAPDKVALGTWAEAAVVAMVGHLLEAVVPALLLGSMPTVAARELLDTIAILIMELPVDQVAAARHTPVTAIMVAAVTVVDTTADMDISTQVAAVAGSAVQDITAHNRVVIMADKAVLEPTIV